MKNFTEKMKPLIMKPIIFHDISIEILDVLRANHSNDWVTSSHHHPWFEFNYVNSGSLYTTIEDTEFLVESGMSYLISPGFTHSHRHNQFAGDDGVCIRWQFQKACDTNIYFKEVTGAFNMPHKHPFVSNIEKVTLNDNYLCNQTAFLTWIINLYADLAENTYLPENAGENNISYQVILYLSEYYNKKISVREISNALNISYRNLSRIFKKETGITIIEKLNEIRVNHAKKLLIGSNAPIYQIAENVGFENEYYFSNTFKQYAYSSPLQFRKLMRDT